MEFDQSVVDDLLIICTKELDECWVRQILFEWFREKLVIVWKKKKISTKPFAPFIKVPKGFTQLGWRESVKWSWLPFSTSVR